MRFLAPNGLCVAALVTCSAAHGAEIDGLTMNTMQLQLQTIETELSNIELRLDDMAKDISEMKECSVLARQSPISVIELRKLAKPKTPQDEANIRELVTKDTLARVHCGLPTK